MEFMSPDRKKGWVVIIRLYKTTSDIYLLKPKGLDESKKYNVTFDNTGKTEMLHGITLMREGLPIQVEAGSYSELLLFETQ